jgi:hypothetical protein
VALSILGMARLRTPDDKYIIPPGAANMAASQSQIVDAGELMVRACK